MQLSNKGCPNHYQIKEGGARCPCPEGRCWYDEATEVQERGEEAPDPRAWLEVVREEVEVADV